MKQEHEIVSQVRRAQQDREAADKLIEQYLPFIKAEAAKVTGTSPSHQEDEVSIAMFAFYEAILAFEPGRGAFLKLAAMTIRSRIIDYRRKQLRHEGSLSLELREDPEDDRSLGDRITDDRANLENHQNRADAQKEIAHFVLQLSEFGLSLGDIADNCPKQARTQRACIQVLDYARQHPALLEQLVQTKKLPMSQLVLGAKADKKTLERHRKYLVAILLAYTNGFEIIRGHLQMLKRKEELAL